MSGCTHLVVVSAWQNFGLGLLCGVVLSAFVASTLVAMALRAQRIEGRPW